MHDGGGQAQRSDNGTAAAATASGTGLAAHLAADVPMVSPDARDAVVAPASMDREVTVQRAVHRGRDIVAVVDDAALVSVAHGFLTLERLGRPKQAASA
jgi:hypothetical protein